MYSKCALEFMIRDGLFEPEQNFARQERLGARGVERICRTNIKQAIQTTFHVFLCCSQMAAFHLFRSYMFLDCLICFLLRLQFFLMLLSTRFLITAISHYRGGGGVGVYLDLPWYLQDLDMNKNTENTHVF